MDTQREARSREANGLGRILLIRRPSDWAPTGVHDIPPNVEPHYEDSEAEATGFRESFNQAEMKNPSGWWAV